ncbi:MAG: FAD-dependent oxidoreductase, partial [Miltoncostaeaceae bacterium]
MERVVGVPGLWATAYGNVGSSIYYALGLVAAYALGLTPLVFLFAGLIFAATAVTYTEGTAMFPEAGGSSSFARQAFNEGAAFGAAWGQMLNYIITIAISAFFVPHYLGVFWEPLRTNPWEVIVGIGVAPATGWCEGSGLTINNGIVCDAHLNAGVPRVYAAGDLLRWPNNLFTDVEPLMRVEHWTNAAEQGAHAAKNLLAEINGSE